MALIARLLMLQPDFGSTILFAGRLVRAGAAVGLSLKRIALIAGGAGVAMVVGAYLFYDNARHRIDAFLGGGTAFDQVDLAQKTLAGGRLDRLGPVARAHVSWACPKRIPTISSR